MGPKASERYWSERYWSERNVDFWKIFMKTPLIYAENIAHLKKIRMPPLVWKSTPLAKPRGALGPPWSKKREVPCVYTIHYKALKTDIENIWKKVKKVKFKWNFIIFSDKAYYKWLTFIYLFNFVLLCPHLPLFVRYLSDCHRIRGKKGRETPNNTLKQ